MPNIDDFPPILPKNFLDQLENLKLDFGENGRLLGGAEEAPRKLLVIVQEVLALFFNTLPTKGSPAYILILHLKQAEIEIEQIHKEVRTLSSSPEVNGETIAIQQRRLKAAEKELQKFNVELKILKKGMEEAVLRRKGRALIHLDKTQRRVANWIEKVLEHNSEACIYPYFQEILEIERKFNFLHLNPSRGKWKSEKDVDQEIFNFLRSGAWKVIEKIKSSDFPDAAMIKAKAKDVKSKIQKFGHRFSKDWITNPFYRSYKEQKIQLNIHEFGKRLTSKFPFSEDIQNCLRRCLENSENNEKFESLLSLYQRRKKVIPSPEELSLLIEILSDKNIREYLINIKNKHYK